MREANELELAALARLGLAQEPHPAPLAGESVIDALVREGRLTHAQALVARGWVTRHATPCTCGRRWLRDEACPSCGATVPAEPPPPPTTGDRPRPGQQVGPLELLDELGRGAAGVVYRARHRTLKREVALKTVEGAADPRRRRRVQREVEALARLSHPGIVAIHAVHELPSGLAIEMELVPGQTLAQRVKMAGALPWREATSLVARLAAAVDYAHGEGVLHRDLKPENILLRGADGSPVIADFGLSRITDQASSLTGAGAVLGTPLYMAPEAYEGDFGPGGDVYGLGAILHTLLHGHARYDDVRSAPELIHRILQNEAPPDSPGAPPALGRVVAHALQANPARRYARARELADDLERVLHGQPLAHATSAPARPWRRLALSAVGALVFACGALLALRDGARVAPPPASPRSELTRALDLLATPAGGTPRARASALARLSAALDEQPDHAALVDGLEQALSAGRPVPELRLLRIRLAGRRGEPLRVEDLAALTHAEPRGAGEACLAALELGTRPSLASPELLAAASDLVAAHPQTPAASWLLGVALCAGGDPVTHARATQALAGPTAVERPLRADLIAQALEAAAACGAALERHEAPADGGRTLVEALGRLLADPELRRAPAVVLGPLTSVTARSLILEGRSLDLLRPKVLQTLLRVLEAATPGLRLEQRALRPLAVARLDDEPVDESPPSSSDLVRWSEALAAAGDPLLGAAGLELSIRLRREREGPCSREDMLALLDRVERCAALNGPFPDALDSPSAERRVRTLHRLALARLGLHEALAASAPPDGRKPELRLALQAARDALQISERYGFAWREDFEPDSVIRLSLALGDWDGAAALVSRSAAPHATRADVLRRRGRASEAVAAAEAALADAALSPAEVADLHAVRILALADAGRIDDAREAQALLEEALQTDPAVLLDDWTAIAVANRLAR